MYKKNDALKRFAAFVMALLMIFNMADFVPEIAIAIAEGEVIPEQQETPPVDAGNSAGGEQPAGEVAPAGSEPAPAPEAPAADGAPSSNEPAPEAPAADGAPSSNEPAPEAPAADGAPSSNEPAQETPAADGASFSDQPAPEVPAADGTPSSNEPAPEAPVADGTPSSEEPAQETPAADRDEAGKESAPAAETPVMESEPVKEDPVVEIDPVEKESASDEGKQKEETPAENETESDGEDEQEEVPAEKESALDEENNQEETPVVKETESDKEGEQEEVPAEKESALDEESNQEETPVVKETESDKEDEQEEVPAEKESELDEENNQEETPVVKETESDKEDEQDNKTEKTENSDKKSDVGETAGKEQNSETEESEDNDKVVKDEPEDGDQESGTRKASDNEDDSEKETDKPTEPESEKGKEQNAASDSKDQTVEEVKPGESSETAAALSLADGVEKKDSNADSQHNEDLSEKKDEESVPDGDSNSDDFATPVIIKLSVPKLDVSRMSAGNPVLENPDESTGDGQSSAVSGTTNPTGETENSSALQLDNNAAEGTAAAEPAVMLMTHSNPVMLAAAPLGSSNTQTEPSVLQSRITAAIQAAKKADNTLSGHVQVILAKGTTYEGEVKIGTDYYESSKYDFKDDFELELTTEDAGTDGLQADGKVKFTGEMTIKGISVIIKGMGLPGTVKLDGTASKLDYYGSSKDDAVNITAENGAKATVNTGAGSDTVSVNVKTGANAEVNTGAGGDTVNAEANSGRIVIDTGADMDTVSAVVANGGSADINTGSGDDTVKLDVQKGAADTRVSTGEGDDTVSVYNSNPKDPADSTITAITVDMGDGVNEASVDLSLADSAKQITVKGSQSSVSRLNLSGTLQKNAANNPITGTESNMTLTSSSGKQLNVVTENIGTMTDTLGNKNTKTLTSTNGKFDYTAEEPFTNYILKVLNSTLDNVTIKSKDGKKLALSNVVIDTDTVPSSDNTLTVTEGKTVLVQGLNLILRGQNIVVDGTLRADLVQLEASDGTNAHKYSIKELYNAYNKTESKADAVADTIAGMAANMINVSDRATIVIGNKAAVYSSGDVIMLARVEQSGGMISLASGFNLVNVKVARASIDIKGKVYAGVTNYNNAGSNNIQFKQNNGSVIANAEIKTTIGYDAKGKELEGMPLAVSVVSADAAVKVENGAEIKSARDISLSSKSDLKIYTRADSGLLSKYVPVAVAVSVLANDASTTVNGTLNANRNVKVSALGNIQATTIADKGGSHDNASGGFFGVTVALQDALAKLGPTAKVTAIGDVSVLSSAIEKIDNRAASATQSIDKPESGWFGEVKKMGITLLTEKVLPWVREKIDGKEVVDLKKLLNAFEKASSASKSVQLDDNAQNHGDVTITDKKETVEGKEYSVAYIKIVPRDGYKVKKVYWRGYNPGESAYAAKEITNTLPNKENEYKLAFEKQYVTLFVEYVTSDGTTVVDGIFSDNSASKSDSVDINSLLESVNNSTDDNTKNLDDAIRAADNIETAELKLTGEGGGALLNYESDPDDLTKSYLKVIAGENLRLVPNPSTGKALKKGGLTATYTVKENDKEVQKTVVINPDEKNRYIFKVPETFMLSKGLQVKAVFVDSSSQDAAADATQTQLTGAVGVVVTENNSNALIDEKATVNAGGSITVDSGINTDVSNKADGTSVSKQTSSGGSSGTDYAIKRDDNALLNVFNAPGNEYVLLMETIGSTETVVFERDESSKYKYVFTPDKPNVVGATLVYYAGGKRQTMTLKPANGKYTVDLNAIPNLDKGSVSQVTFIFGESGETQYIAPSSTVSAVIPNAIKFTYNRLQKGKGTDAEYTPIGQINLVENESGNGKYVFTAVPAATYVLDGSLKASWVETNGSVTTKELTKSGNKWVLENASIPQGALITVSCTFKDDFRDFKTEGNISNGTVTLYDKQVKAKDTPKISVEPKAGYSVKEIKVTYIGGSGQTTLTKTDGKIKQVNDSDGNPIEGLYEFTIGDKIMSGSDVKVTAEFEAKTIGLYAGENDTDRSKFVFSEYNVAIGDKVTVKPNDDSVKNGYKVTKITVYKGNTEVASSTNGSFTIPSDKNIGSNDRLTVKVETGLKEIELKEAKLTNGTVKAASARADKGETVTVDISPADGYRIKPGTLKAVIRAKDGTYSSEVYMDRKNDKTYTFIMPADIDPQKTEVSFTGEFVPGESDTSSYNTSLGAGIAVTVANSGSRAEAKGTAAAGGNVTIKSSGTGSIKTEAKAGYSKTNNGFAGGIAVQVASVDSRALVYRNADIKLNGTFKVASQGKTTFSVTGDASGKKGADAKGTGVGSGIAVAVNGSDSIAAVEDGAKVAANNNKQLKGISVTATQKLTDTVSAKAGAAGGTAVVPVAAVDVMGGSANAYLGKVAGNLTVSGNVAVSAKNETEHTISADASAVGKGAGIGVAIAVSVLSDEARARLNQSVKAGQVTVAAETVAKVTETASAGAEGGKKDGKSADQKADGLLSGAAKLAAKNKSSAVSGGKVDKAIKDRQKAETSEGTVGAAGAVAVNVQSSISHAEIMNGVNVDASGLVSVTAVNGTTSKVKANASATNSNIGIGVGAAVNVITLNNIAHIGDGQIKAAMLAVSATTKEAKNQNKVVQKVSTTDGLTRQVTDMVKEYVGKLFTEMGLDKYGLSKELMEKLAGEVTNAVADTLVKATGLSSLLGDGDITKKYEAALKKLTSSKDGLMGLPDKLIDPFMEVMNDVYDLSGLTADQLKELKSDLLSTFTTQLQTQLTQSGNGVLDGVKEGMHDYLKENGGDLLSGIFSGKFKENTQKVFAQAKEELGKAVKKQLKAFVINTFQETIKAVDIPGVTQKNLNALGDALQGIQNAYTEKSIDNILSTACGYITDTFKQEVFDYEKMITSLSQTDFSAKIGETLRAAAKNASVALTNTAIAALTDHYDLKLSAQSDPTGHVIDTQAVSGAGAKDVGIAGSVAITVLNAETRADIAKSGNMISVTNGMTVDAKEVRNVKNVASAALDANGDASANKAAGAEANADVAGKNKTVYGVHATLETAAGATVEISEADKNLDKPVFHVILQDGFKMPDKVNYTYTDTDGKEKTGTIGFTKSGNEYLVDPKSGDLAGLDTKRDVRLMLTPVEDLYTLPAPKVDTSVAGADKAVSLAVKGREAENGSYSARTGDVVELKIQKAEGRKVDSVGYSYTDENGKTHNVRIVTDESQVQAGQDVVYALRKGNGKEAIYEIVVPKGKITAFDVKIVAGEENPEDSDTTAKDGSGKSVGVGAAFSMVYGDTKTTAEVGARSALTTGDLTVKAASDHTEKIASAAGSDPLQGAWDPDQTKNFSLDASVALNILDTAVKASVSESTNEAKVNGALSVTADENAVTGTAASAFSVGGSTAVGASVALNIANSKVNADMLTDAVVDNDVKISATTYSEDVTNAIASAMGGDIGRNMARIGKAGDKVESGANKLLDGSYVDSLGKTDKKSTKTNDRINGRLDEKGNGDTKAKASTSTNALRSLGVSTADGNAGSEGTDAAKQKIEDTTDTKLGSQDAQKSSKIQVGAAVGVTVASHEAGTSVGAIKSYTGNVEAIAKNTGNFATLGTGAAMSLAEKANSIAVGVAVTVNNNKSNVNAKGDIAAEGDVTLSSELTQNMDGDFRGRLAAQSLAGSVAGKDSSVSLGGAVSVVVANAQSTVGLAGSTDVAGRNVTVEATDKSKLAARAGGLSISKGSSIGMGIASTTIVSNNEVKATVGDNVEITADSFRLNAEKKQVKDSDFKQLIDLRTLVTDSSALSDEQRKEAKTGFIDVHKGKSDNSYKVEVNLSQEKLLGTLDGLNFLSSQNTYAEAIAGSVATGSTNASLAGSFAVATNNNKIAAQLGSNVTISAANGNADVSAVNGATTRVIAGSLSAAPAKTSVGATVAVLVNNDSARAVTGDNARVKASGNMSQKAEQTGNTQVFTGAMSVAAGKEAGNAVGGAVNVIVNKSTAESIIGKKANISVGGAADISSKTDLDLMLISGSANVSVGPKASIAAGGTVNVIVDKAVANTTLGENNTVEADKVDITSSVIDRMISGAMSASAAISPNGKAGAGAVNVIISNSAADTTIGSKASLKAVSGDMRLKADNDAGVINATLAASGSGGTAIGGSFNVNVFDREAAVKLTDGTLNAGGNLSVQAGGRNYNILGGLALAGSVGGSSITGNADVLVESSRIHTDIEKGVTAKAGKNALLESYLSDFTVGAAGSIALGGGAAVGATVLTVVKNNDVRTRLGTSSVTGSGPDAVKSLSGEDVKGIFVGANAKETQFLGAAGVAVSGSAAVNGVVDVLVNNNTVLADASRAKLTSGAVDTENVPQIQIRIITHDRIFGRSQSRTVNVDAAKAQAYIESELAKANDQFSISADVFAKGQWLSYKDGLRELTTTPGAVTVKATDDTRQIVLAGGVSAASSAGVGASVVTLVSGKTVKALAHDMTATDDIKVIAENRDDITQAAVSVGIAGTAAVQLGAAVQVLGSKAVAEVGSDVISRSGSVNINSQNTTKLINAAGAIAGSGAAAVTPVGVVTYFTGESEARLKSGSIVDAQKDVNIRAEAVKDVDLYSAGFAVGGAAGVSGTANVLVSKDKTKAVAEEGTRTAADNMNVEAEGNYKLISATGVIAGGTAGVGINAVVSVLKSNTTAEMGGTASLNGSMNVKADSKRDVTNAGANLSVGAAGVGVNVMVLVAGTKMSQDAADMLTKGGSDNKGLNADTLMSQIASADKGGSKYYKNSLNGKILAEDTAGNGHYESKQGIGGQNGSGDKKQGTFDASTGYRSEDFDNEKYDDNTENQRGEKLETKDNSDIADAKKVNTYTYTNDPDDAVIARITENAQIDKVKDVAVISSQQVTADLFGATVGAGAVGVAASAAVAMLRSNVLAGSNGTVRNASGNVSVTAESKSGGKVKDRSDDIKKFLKDLDPANGGIRAIGVTGAAGAVGVAVGAAVVLTDNMTQAALGGTVNADGKVNVNAVQDYDHITSAVGTASAGAVAVGASVAVAQSNGTVNSKINDKTTVKSGSDVNVTSTGNQNVTAVAATAGAGLVAVNAGVALSINRMTQNTGIGSGASITARNITVKAGSDTTADSGLVGVSIGGVGVALGAAVSQVDAKLNTNVENATLKATNGKIEVFNDAISKAVPKVFSLAGGGVAAGGNVLLSFNETISRARVANSTINAGTLDIAADLQGDAVSKILSAQAGGIAAGVSVNVADMRADNRAVLENSSVTVDRLEVHTGRDSHASTTAEAATITGGLGFAAISLNAAIARNNTKSFATVSGGSINAKTNAKVSSKDTVKADASVHGVQISGLNIAGNTVVALNDADTRVTVKTDTFEVKDGKAEFGVEHRATTDAGIETGGGSIIEGSASVSAAYGRSSGIIDVYVNKLTAGSLTASGKTSSVTNAKVTNGSFAALKANAMVGAAYEQGVYSTKVSLGPDSRVNGQVDVTTDYVSRADSDVTPHKGGLDASLLKMSMNLALARNTAFAGSDLVLEGAMNAGGDVNIKTVGDGSAKAVIRPVKVEIGGAKLAANFVNADNSLAQAATLNMNGGTLNAEGKLNIQALSRGAEASASLGTAGADKSVSVSLANFTVSRAYATENLSSTAGLFGQAGNRFKDSDKIQVTYQDARYKFWSNGYYDYAKVKENIESGIWTNVRTVSDGQSILLSQNSAAAVKKDKADASANTVNAAGLNILSGMSDENMLSKSSATSNGAKEVSFLTLGNLEARATASDSFSAALQGAGVTVKGKAEIQANTKTSSYAFGGAPGGYAAISGGISNTYANIGSEKNRQTAQALIGEGVRLTANEVVISASNRSETEARFEKKGGYSLASIGSSSQPTETWRDTSVIIGQKAEITSRGKLAVESASSGSAKSIVNNSGTGLILNVATMQGKNTLNENVNLLIGEDVKVKADGETSLKASGKLGMEAASNYTGDFTVVNRTSAKSENILNRTQTLMIGKGVQIEADRLSIVSEASVGDEVKAESSENTGSSMLDFVKTEATNTVKQTNTLDIGPKVKATANGLVNISAVTGGHFVLHSTVNARKGLRLVAKPEAHSNNVLAINNYTNINAGRSSADDRTYITSKNDEINVFAALRNLVVSSDTTDEADGAIGGVYSWANVGADYNDQIWVDNTTFRAGKRTLLETNHNDSSIAALSNAALHGLGFESPTAKIWGTINSVIRSSNTGNVDGGNNFVHTANPTAGIVIGANANGSWLSKGNRDVQRTIRGEWFCDFCRHTSGTFGDDRRMNIAAALDSAFTKALKPIKDIDRMMLKLDSATKARYGEEEYQAADRLYVFAIEKQLRQNVTFGEARIEKYRLWTDALTQHHFYLLPNAARLFRTQRLDYVADVIHGDVLGDGAGYDIDIITALNDYAFNEPVIPIGSSGSLDFATGTLKVPAFADFDLYLGEVSGKWLLECFNTGFMRREDIGQPKLSVEMLNADDAGELLANSTIISEVMEGSGKDGWKRYWLGHTPETAEDPNEPLIYLLLNEETDEVDAFRTSRTMIENGRSDVDVSLYISRDSKSDRMGEEKYNVLFIDTPAGEKSFAIVVTNVLGGRELEVPKTMRVKLRGVSLGADYPAYSLTDHFMVLNNGMDGVVSMFDDFYHATFDGDVFDSGYTRIEGIQDNNLTITLTEGQKIWPEWIDDHSAEDIEGDEYTLVNNLWYNTSEAHVF